MNCNSITFPKIKENIIFHNKSFLKIKRKRSHKELKEEGTHSKENLKKKTENDYNFTDNQNKANIAEKKKECIKFQYLPKNIFSVIFAYLRMVDFLKLKNVGSHSIRIYINELLNLMKNNNNLTLHEIHSKSKLYMNYYDSINCKKYYLKNCGSEVPIKNSIKVKYVLYNNRTNKSYVLIHIKLKYFFCDSNYDSNLGKDICLSLPDKDYYEKFQFLEGFNNLEVAIFALHKILLYNLVTGVRDHCIILCRSCDFVLYKKELKLLITSHFPDEIVFFKIYTGKTNIKEPKYIFKTEDYSSENKGLPIILNFNDFINNDDYICIYIRKCKNIFIFDCKLFKLAHKIVSETNIDRVNINDKYLICITNDVINYYSNINSQYSFLYSFNLKNINKNANIRYISLLDSKIFNNMFLVIIQNPNKNIYKPILLFLENNGDNGFYYSLSSLKNEITDYIYDDEMICTSCLEEKINNENIIKMNMVICHSKKLSSDDSNEGKNNKDQTDYYIKEYAITL